MDIALIASINTTISSFHICNLARSARDSGCVISNRCLTGLQPLEMAAKCHFGSNDTAGLSSPPSGHEPYRKNTTWPPMTSINCGGNALGEEVKIRATEDPGDWLCHEGGTSLIRRDI